MNPHTTRPTILVTNDDGIFSKGIAALVEVAREFGFVSIVAPDSPRSAQGHAITIEHPLYLRKSKFFQDIEGVEAYECSGTPVDCVKLAKHVLHKHASPDLCLSGINHGSNSSINILYSGTMSAAMEASIEGIPAIGFSLLDFRHDADFEASKSIVRQLLTLFFEQGMGNTNLLNVNIPKLPLSEIKGMRVCRQAEGFWREDFKTDIDEMGRNCYWLRGNFESQETDPKTDIIALEAGYVSIVPTHHDLTHHVALSELELVFNT